MLARHLRADNKDELLSRAAGKSKRAVEELLAAYTGVAPQPRSSLRPQYVPVTHDAKKQSSSAPPEGSTVIASGAQQSQEAGEASELPGFMLQHEQKSPPAAAAESQLVHQLRCTISDDTKTKLLRLAEVLGIVDPIANLEQIITKATEIALQTKDPALQREHRKPVSQPEPHPAQPICSPPCATPSVTTSTPVTEKQEQTLGARKRSRYISRTNKRTLLQRAGYQCEFMSPEGKRCCQKTALQIDHVLSFSRGGSNQLDNLMVLCGGHNRRKFEREVTPPGGLFPPAYTA
jgi:5-methylcytosine-specific restriction endonuclease McrA